MIAFKKMNELSDVFKKSENIVYRKIADEYILVPIRNNVGDLQNIYTLNEVGARVWELIDGKKTLNQISNELLEEFEIDKETLDKDIDVYIAQLLSEQALSLCHSEELSDEESHEA
jgi:hypothetical protein